MIKDSQSAIKKYEAQLNEVKNNREYDAISKEIEIQGLEIQVCEKRIREAEFEIKNKTNHYDSTVESLNFSKEDLAGKNKELESISGETQKEEDQLINQVEKAEKNIEERLLKVGKKLVNLSGMVWPWSLSTEIVARGAIIKYHFNCSPKSDNVKRSLSANTVNVSLLMRKLLQRRYK